MSAETSVVTAAGESPAVRSRSRFWARLRHGVSNKDALAVLDQAVVSGTSFVTTVLVGRWCGADELGVYSLGFTLLVAWVTVHESLIALPYTIFRPRLPEETQAAAARSALACTGVLSLVATAMMVVIAAILALTGALPALPAVITALALITPLALLREFGRRFAFAHLHMGEALVLDFTVAGVQLAGLAWLATTGNLSAVTAYMAVGVACGLAAAAWFANDRLSLRGPTDGRPFGRQVAEFARSAWKLGKWFFASQLTILVQAYFIHWLLAGVDGVAATGVYVACMQVIQFANPLLLGISNTLAPRTAHAFHAGGGPALRRVVFQTTVLLGVLMILFNAVILFLGDDTMEFLFHGEQYVGYQHAITVLGLGMLITALGMPASNAVAAIERPDLIFKTGLASVIVTVILVPCLVAGWGVTGAAYGFFAGCVVGSLGRWLAFAALVPATEARTALNDVLARWDGAGTGEWAVEPLDQGAQASLFLCRSGVESPARDLVVKVYKTARRTGFQTVPRDQFAAMTRLHVELDGRTVNGWTIHAPQPLLQFDEPAALIMTWVPGKALSACLERPGSLSPEAMASIADTVTAVMGRCWMAGGEAHGDFNLDNILCDLSGRSLSFVDPGMRGSGYVAGAETAGQCSAAADDLAHLLFETEVSIKRTLIKPGVRRRQRRLGELMVRSYLAATPPHERLRLLDDIGEYAREYLNSLHSAWTPRGLWRGFIRRVATRRIDETLRRFRTEATSIIPTQHVPTATVNLVGPVPVPRPGETRSRTRALALKRVFETLDRAGIRCCLPYRCAGSDIDFVTDARPEQVAAVLIDAGVDVVRCLSGHVVVAAKTGDGSPCFVDLDVSANYGWDGRRFYSGAELLEGTKDASENAERSIRPSSIVPEPSLEFGCTLVRRITKGAVTEDHARRLTELYRTDPRGCQEQVARFWRAGDADIIIAAVETGNWAALRRDLPRLRAQLLRRTALRHPLWLIGHHLSRLVRKVERFVRSEGGVSVVFLGPDGAGKSTVIAGVRRDLTGLFPLTATLLFPPALLRRLLGWPEGPVALPHSLPPRSCAASVIRAVGYWFVYYSVGYWFGVRPVLAQSTLVMHDRHMVDALVDPARYRYGGPRWLLRLIWRLVPKPDLIFLLDAPADVLQSRKQEVSPEVTARQRESYRALLAELGGGEIIDVNRPLREIVTAVDEVIMRHVGDRVRRRLRKKG
jgi:O-antigen/teichoic acid export membrane protein/thymidylate kinase